MAAPAQGDTLHMPDAVEETAEAPEVAAVVAGLQTEANRVASVIMELQKDIKKLGDYMEVSLNTHKTNNAEWMIQADETIASSRAALQEVKQGFEDSLQTVDDKINGIKAEILAEVMEQARHTITPTFITTQLKSEVAKEVKEAMTNLGRTSSHGWEEQIEIAVQKATEQTEAKTNTSIQEAIDAEREWVGEAHRRMTAYTDRKISEMRQHDSGGGDGNHHERKSNLISPKDTQPGKIQTKPSKAEFTHWRKCVELFVDAVNGWKGGSLILERLRVEKAEVTQTVFDDIVRAIRENPVHDGVLGSAVWEFSDRTTEF